MTFLLTLLLGFGIFFFVMGVALFTKSKDFTDWVVSLADKKGFFMGMIPVASLMVTFGFITLLYQGPFNTSKHYTIAVCLVAWLFILKGLVYLFMPTGTLRKMVRRFAGVGHMKMYGFVTSMLGVYFLYSAIDLVSFINEQLQFTQF